MPGMLSALLLDLYQGSETIETVGFQYWALERVKEVIPFESALWGYGVMNGSHIMIHNAQPYNLPPTMLTDYVQINGEDPVLLQIFKNRGSTFNFDIAHWRPDPRLEAFHKRYGIDYVLSTMLHDPVMQFVTAVSLYRPRAQTPFSEQERIIKEDLMPHLAGLFTAKQLAHVQNRADAAERLIHVPAMMDNHGMLHLAGQGFAELLRREWPEWRGPKMPGDLIDFISDDISQPYIGHEIVMKISAIDDMFGIKARHKADYDHLGRRERQVAEMFADGQTYKEIARELHLAPSTVSNELHTVYIKLNIASKPELMKLVSALK